MTPKYLNHPPPNYRVFNKKRVTSGQHQDLGLGLCGVHSRAAVSPLRTRAQLQHQEQRALAETRDTTTTTTTTAETTAAVAGEAAAAAGMCWVLLTNVNTFEST